MYSTLFSPFQLKSMTLKNRLVMSPMGSNFALPDGSISDEHIEYYRLRAKGGVGLIIMENVTVDFPRGCNGTTQLRLDADCFVPRLYKFNEIMHRYGTRTAVQLNHAGCKTVPSRIGCQPEAPSALKLKDGSLSQAMSREDMARVSREFGDAARRAVQAGFDCVEIHAGHGYLLNQFLSPLQNQRTDEYGGCPENRARFCREVIDSIRAAVGSNFPVLMRVSVDDFIAGGNTLEDSLELLKYLREGVDLFDCSSGSKYAMDAAQLPDGWKSYLAGAVRKKFSVPVSTVGNIRCPGQAEEFLNTGVCDLVVLGRALIADPEWPNKAAAGQEEDIRPCISCNIGCVTHRAMLNQPIRCTVNPSISAEEEYKKHPVKKPCHVVVVGGGAAGLEAACTAAEMGCQVTLLEKQQELGGWLAQIARIPDKFRMKRLYEWFLRRVSKTPNLEVRTGTCADPSILEELRPDLVVWAVGSRPLLPPIPGLSETLDNPAGNIGTVAEFLRELKPEEDYSGRRIGIAGGGAVALDIAEYYAERGASVSIVELLPELGRGLDGFSKGYVTDLLEKKGAEILLSHKLLEVRPGKFIISGEDGTRDLTFDQGYICLGLQSQPEDGPVFEYCRDHSIPLKKIGDSVRGRRLYEAIQDGRNVAWDINDMGFCE